MIDSKYEEMIRYACKIEKIDKNLALVFTKKIVKSAAKIDKNDILEFFYGKNIYTKIKSCSDGIDYISILDSLKELYGCLSKCYIDDIFIFRFDENFDKDYLDFFIWLNYTDKKINIKDDVVIIKKIINKVKSKSNIRTDFRLTNTLAIELVKKIVIGRYYVDKERKIIRNG